MLKHNSIFQFLTLSSLMLFPYDPEVLYLYAEGCHAVKNGLAENVSLLLVSVKDKLHVFGEWAGLAHPVHPGKYAAWTLSAK